MPRSLLVVVMAHEATERDSARRLITVASIGLVALGIGLSVIGLVGDGYGWWESRPFLTNVISTTTSACFGLPVALVVLRRATELRGAEIAAQRSAVESTMLCERMQANTRRIERYWVEGERATGKQSRDDDEWGVVIADVIRLVDLLRSPDKSDKAEIAAAVRPLTERFRLDGLGTVYAAADEIFEDWSRLQTLAGSMNHLRQWEAEWTGPGSIDVRSFSGVLETFDQQSSHIWQDYFARLPDDVELKSSSVMPALQSNARLALRFLHDTATILMRVGGRDVVPAFWQTAHSAYEQYLATRYENQQKANAEVGSAAPGAHSDAD